MAFFFIAFRETKNFNKMVFLSRFSHFEHFFYFGGADISCGHVFLFVAFRETKKEKGKKDQNKPTARQKPESRATPTAWSVRPLTSWSGGEPPTPWNQATHATP